MSKNLLNLSQFSQLGSGLVKNSTPQQIIAECYEHSLSPLQPLKWKDWISCDDLHLKHLTHDFPSQAGFAITHSHLYATLTTEKEELLILNKAFKSGRHYIEFIYPLDCDNTEVGILQLNSPDNTIKATEAVRLHTTSHRFLGLEIDLERLELRFWMNGFFQPKRTKSLIPGSWIPYIKLCKKGSVVAINPYSSPMFEKIHIPIVKKINSFRLISERLDRVIIANGWNSKSEIEPIMTTLQENYDSTKILQLSPTPDNSQIAIEFTTKEYCQAYINDKKSLNINGSPINIISGGKIRSIYLSGSLPLKIEFLERLKSFEKVKEIVDLGMKQTPHSEIEEAQLPNIIPIDMKKKKLLFIDGSALKLLQESDSFDLHFLTNIANSAESIIEILLTKEERLSILNSLLIIESKKNDVPEYIFKFIEELIGKLKLRLSYKIILKSIAYLLRVLDEEISSNTTIMEGIDKDFYFRNEHQSSSPSNIFSKQETLYKGIHVLCRIEEQLYSLSFLNVELKKKFSHHIRRLNTVFGRLTTFINSCKVNFDPLDLAGLGVYVGNSIEMSLRHVDAQTRNFEIPPLQCPSELMYFCAKALPDSRLLNGKPSTNVPLNIFVNNYPIQCHIGADDKKKKIQCFYHDNANEMLITMSDDGSCMIWDTHVVACLIGKTNFKEKLNEINTFSDITKRADYMGQPVEEKKEKIDIVPIIPVIADELKVEPNKEMLEQLTLMGFPFELSKKALIAIENKGIEEAIEQVLKFKEEMPPETKDRSRGEFKSMLKPEWICEACTFVNNNNLVNCEICETPAGVSAYYTEEEILLEEKKKREENDKKKMEEEKRKQELMDQRRKESLAQSEKLLQFQKLFSEMQARALFQVNLKDNNINGLFIGALLVKSNAISLLRVRRFTYNPDYIRNFFFYTENEMGLSSTFNNYWLKINDQSEFISELSSYMQANFKLQLNSLLPLTRKYLLKDEYVLLPEGEVDLTLEDFEAWDTKSFSNHQEKALIAIIGKNILKGENELRLYEIINTKNNPWENAEATFVIKHLKTINLAQLSCNSKIIEVNDKTIKLIIGTKITLLDVNKMEIEQEEECSDIPDEASIHMISENSLIIKSNDDLVRSYCIVKSQDSIVQKTIFDPNNESTSFKNKPIYQCLPFSVNNHKSVHSIAMESSLVNDGKISVHLNTNYLNNSVDIKLFMHDAEQFIQKTSESSHNLFNGVLNVSNDELYSFLPLAVVRHYGGQYTSNYYVTKMLYNNSEEFMSNYHECEYFLRHINGLSFIPHSFEIVKSSYNSQNVFPIASGIIFGANSLATFEKSRVFYQMTKSQYTQWLKKRLLENQEFEEWEPIGYFELFNDKPCRIECQISRPITYLLLRPTKLDTEKTVADVQFNNIAQVIKFFGVKGRVIEDATLNHSTFSLQKELGLLELENKTDGIISYNIMSKNCIEASIILEKNVENLKLKITDSALINSLSIRVKGYANESASLIYEMQRPSNAEKELKKLLNSIIDPSTLPENVKDRNINKFEIIYDFLLDNLSQISEIFFENELFELFKNYILNSSDYLISHCMLSILLKISSKQALQNTIKRIFDNILQLPLTFMGFKKVMSALRWNDPQLLLALKEKAKEIIYQINEKNTKKYDLLRGVFQIGSFPFESKLFSDAFMTCNKKAIEINTAHINQFFKNTTKRVIPCRQVHTINNTYYEIIIDLKDLFIVNLLKLYFGKCNMHSKISIQVYQLKTNNIKLLTGEMRYEHDFIQLSNYGYDQKYYGNLIEYNDLNVYPMNIRTDPVRYLKVQVFHTWVPGITNINKEKVPEIDFFVEVEGDDCGSGVGHEINEINMMFDDKNAVLADENWQLVKNSYIYKKFNIRNKLCSINLFENKMKPMVQKKPDNSSRILQIKLHLEELQASLQKKFSSIDSKSIPLLKTQISDLCLQIEAAQIELTFYEPQNSEKSLDFLYSLANYLFTFINEHNICLFDNESNENVLKFLIMIFEIFILRETVITNQFVSILENVIKTSNIKDVKLQFFDYLLNTYVLRSIPSFDEESFFSYGQLIKTLKRLSIPIELIIIKMIKCFGFNYVESPLSSDYIVHSITDDDIPSEINQKYNSYVSLFSLLIHSLTSNQIQINLELLKEENYSFNEESLLNYDSKTSPVVLFISLLKLHAWAMCKNCRISSKKRKNLGILSLNVMTEYLRQMKHSIVLKIFEKNPNDLGKLIFSTMDSQSGHVQRRMREFLIEICTMRPKDKDDQVEKDACKKIRDITFETIYSFIIDLFKSNENPLNAMISKNKDNIVNALSFLLNLLTSILSVKSENAFNIMPTQTLIDTMKSSLQYVSNHSILNESSDIWYAFWKVILRVDDEQLMKSGILFDFIQLLNKSKNEVKNSILAEIIAKLQNNSATLNRIYLIKLLIQLLEGDYESLLEKINFLTGISNIILWGIHPKPEVPKEVSDCYVDLSDYEKLLNLTTDYLTRKCNYAGIANAQLENIEGVMHLTLAESLVDLLLYLIEPNSSMPVHKHIISHYSTFSYLDNVLSKLLQWYLPNCTGELLTPNYQSPSTKKLFSIIKCLDNGLSLNVREHPEFSKLAIKECFNCIKKNDLLINVLNKNELSPYRVGLLLKNQKFLVNEVLSHFLVSKSNREYALSQLKLMEYSLLRLLLNKKCEEENEIENLVFDSNILEYLQSKDSSLMNFGSISNNPGDLENELANNWKHMLNYNGEEIKDDELALKLDGLEPVNTQQFSGVNDWSTFKKGQKNKKIMLVYSDQNYDEVKMLFKFEKTAELRNIKLGLYTTTDIQDKIYGEPSKIIVEGGVNQNELNYLGVMSKFPDEGYSNFSVSVFILNFEDRNFHRPESLQLPQINYLRFRMARPYPTLIENISLLCNKNYSIKFTSISFISIPGNYIDANQKLETLKGMELHNRALSIKLIKSLVSEGEAHTIAWDQVDWVLKQDNIIKDLVPKGFDTLSILLTKYKDEIWKVLTALSRDHVFGDFILESLLNPNKNQLNAPLAAEICCLQQEATKIRVNKFFSFLLADLEKINASYQQNSNKAVLFNKIEPFINEFCHMIKYKLIGDQYNTKISINVSLESLNTISESLFAADTEKASNNLTSLLLNLVSPPPNILTLDTNTITNYSLKLIHQVKNNFEDNLKPLKLLIKICLINQECLTVAIENDMINSLLSQILNEKPAISESTYCSLLESLLLLSFNKKIMDTLISQQIHLKLYSLSVFNQNEEGKTVLKTSKDVTKLIQKILAHMISSQDIVNSDISNALVQDMSSALKKKDKEYIMEYFIPLMKSQKLTLISLVLYDPISQKLIPGLVEEKNNQKLSANFMVNSELMNEKQKEKLGKLIVQSYLGDIYRGGFAKKISSVTALNQNLVIIVEKKSNLVIYTLNLQVPIKKQNNENMYVLNRLGHDCDQVLDFQSEKWADLKGKAIEIVFDEKSVLKSIKIDNEIKWENESNSNFEILGLNSYQPGEDSNILSSYFKYDENLKTSIAKYDWALQNSSSGIAYPVPSSLTIKQLKQLLLKTEKFSISRYGIFESLDDNLTLEEIDNIYPLELCIHISTSPLRQEAQFNYLPSLPTVAALEEKKAFETVISLTLASTETWSNKAAGKKWNDWIKELKQLCAFPGFFTSFVKNMEAIQLLFEVALDLPNSSPNKVYEEKEQKTTGYLHNTLTDLLDSDPSPSLREFAIENQFIYSILQRLEQVSKEKKRIRLDKAKLETIQPTKMLEEKEDDGKKEIKKKKGVGYGNDQHDNSKWNANEFFNAKKSLSEQMISLLSLLKAFFKSPNWAPCEEFINSLCESVFLPVLENGLRTGSILDMGKDVQLYLCYLELVRSIVQNKTLFHLVLELDPKYQPSQTQSIFTLLTNLKDLTNIFISTLGSNTAASAEENKGVKDLTEKILLTFDEVSKALKAYDLEDDGNINVNEILSLPLPEKYKLLLKDLRFDYISMKVNENYVHHYASNIKSEYTPSVSKMIRLAQEFADLSNGLPCEHTNSVFVRCDKERVDVMKALVMGAAGTPYAHGAFEYHIFFDENYPNGPPKVNLETTGYGKTRFNPNLYSCGKVCLSLLGTWRGNATENWDPKLSTILQVLLSVQSIIMSEDVYFNEPGFEGEAGSVEGEKKNEAYSNIVRYSNIRYAMIEQIRKPSPGFETVIRRHFYLKKDEILKEAKKWLKYALVRETSYTGLVQDHNSTWCSEFNGKNSYADKLKTVVNELEDELNKLFAPSPQELLSSKLNVERRKKIIKKKIVKEEVNINKGSSNLQEIDLSYEETGKTINRVIDINDEKVRDRWSRYIGAMGMEAVAKQSEAKIFISGLGPLGIEIAKNITLSGVKQLVLHDYHEVTYNDLSGQFFINESDIDLNRLEVCFHKIQQLNFYVKLEKLNYQKHLLNDLDKKGLDIFDMIILTDNTEEEKIAVGAFCREKNIKLIIASANGPFSKIFCDFGSNFVVQDKDGEEITDMIIKNITNEEEGILTLLEGTKHNLQDGDEIEIKGVEGMELLQDSTKNINGQKFKIMLKSKFVLKIQNTTQYAPYLRNGIARQVKNPIKIQFQSYSEAEKNEVIPHDANLVTTDFLKLQHPHIMHICYQALGKFQPAEWNLNDANKFLEMCKDIAPKFEKTYKFSEDVKNFEKLVLQFSLTQKGTLNPLCAFIGGFVAQEIVKGITGKFMPINQYAYFNANEIIPEWENELDLENLIKSNACQIKNNRFDGIRTCVGEEVLKKIQLANVFMVGAGAIGCELLKNYAMISLGVGDCNDISGKIIVTDPDVIETSNLTRQFLFREKHLRKPKSQVACAAALQMNPLLKSHIISRLDKVYEGTEKIFNNNFFEKLSCVTNALDNVQARRYIDGRCVSARIPLLESGTMGAKGHVQVILPDKTESYSTMKDPEDQGEIPYCTLKMFPEEALHCVEWARDKFEKLFSQKPKTLIRCYETKHIIPNSTQDVKNLLEGLKILKSKPENLQDCIKYAKKKFQKYFNNDILQLLHVYPLDCKTKEGKLFWTLPKRPPKPITFDSSNPLHAMVIVSITALLARIYNIPVDIDFRQKSDQLKIIEIADKIVIPIFVPSDQKSKEIQSAIEKENQKKNVAEIQEGEEEEKISSSGEDVCEIQKEFCSLIDTKFKEKPKILPEEFEKDEDLNFHIDFIHALTNNRAGNYSLDQLDWMTVKIKAGKIIPALASTTACIAGLQTLELIKVLKQCKFEDTKNSFLNLALPLLTQTEPGPPPKTKLNEEISVTLWDRWTINQTPSCTLGSVLKELHDKYKLIPTDIIFKSTPLHLDLLYKDKQNEREENLSRKLLDCIEEESPEYLDLTVTFKASEQDNKVLTGTPIVRVHLK